MWPSFSLCACRMRKMRSCLRMPLAPAISSERAIRLNSVMFFSLSSEIVILYLRLDLDGRCFRREIARRVVDETACFREFIRSRCGLGRVVVGRGTAPRLKRRGGSEQGRVLR